MLTVVLILSALGAVAVTSQPDATPDNPDVDPLALAKAVKTTMESLGTGMSGSELKDELLDIVVNADVLLAIYGYQLGDLSDFVKIAVSGRGLGLVVAAALNSDLTILSQYSDKLKQDVEAGDNSAIVENIINIRVTATRILSALSSFKTEHVKTCSNGSSQHIDLIRYGPVNRGARQEMSKRHGKIEIDIGSVHIEIRWG